MPAAIPIILGGGLWTPANISTAIWLDAADAGTITLNGTTVSQWADKSGNNRHATQANAADQPTYGVSNFSLPSVNFLDKFMSMPAISAAASNWAAYGVFRQTETSPPNNDSLFASTSSFNGSFQIGSGGTLLTVSASSDASGTFIGATIDPSIAAVPRILGIEANTSGYFTYLNGTASGSNTAGTILNSAQNGMKLGQNRNGGLYLQGNHAEWVILNGVPSTDVRQRLEGYFSWKWGQQALLPATHPYKQSAPRV
jgi:hypothetical protein